MRLPVKNSPPYIHGPQQHDYLSRVSMESGMQSKRSIIVNCVVSLVIIASSVVGFMLLGRGQAPQRKPPAAAPGVAVKAVAIQPHSGSITILSHGVVVPLRDIRLASEVNGRVIEQSTNLRSGTRVSKGEMLIQVDPTDFELEVQRLKAQLEQNRAELSALEVSVANNRKLLQLATDEHALTLREKNRLEDLQTSGAASISDIEGSKRAEIVAQVAIVRLENTLRDLDAQRELLQERLKLTAIDLEKAELDKRRTTVHSPIDGVVVESMIEEQSFVNTGQPFAVIEDTSVMEVQCNLTAEEMRWIWATAEDTLPADGRDTDYRQDIPALVSLRIDDREYQWQARFERVAGSGIDQRTRTTPCLFRVAEPNAVSMVDNAGPVGPSSLMRGMFVTVAIACTPNRPLLRAPNTAIRPGEEIWLAQDGRLTIRSVKLVSRNEEHAIFQSDQIAAGNLAIVSPVAGARNGLLVNTGGKRARAGGPGKPGKSSAPDKRPGKSQSSQTTPRDKVPAEPNAAVPASRAGWRIVHELATPPQTIAMNHGFSLLQENAYSWPQSHPLAQGELSP